jgi:peptidoglycan hydrolase-like protein with peptidoglycan-binding domain
MARTWPVVRRGAQSPTVRTVQWLLRARGRPLAVDGDFGPVTEDQVEHFQRAEGLTADGIVGNQTWPRLIIQVARGSESDAVRAAQDQLGLRDLPETRDLAVDGDFGPRTEAAVRAFQTWVRANQGADLPLAVDGIVGPDTWFGLVAAFGPVVD